MSEITDKILLSSVSKAFHPDTVNRTEVFNNFDFSVKSGAFVSIVGSNGSGKTTLLNLIAGSIFPDKGRILLDGKDITGVPEYLRAKRIGRVFQDPSKGVAGSMTIAENMSLADHKGKRYGFSAGVNKKRLTYYRDLVASIGLGLEDKMHVPMRALSGGQRQSVSLIMATMTPIDVLILDEHTAALDPKTADVVMELTDKIVREKNLTAVMVTHNLRYAVDYGNRLVMMHDGTTVIDVEGEEKKNKKVEDLLHVFNTISIECGN